MNNWKKLLSALLAVCMLLGVCACGLAEDAAEDAVVCTVNGEEVLVSQVEEEVLYLVSYYSQLGYDMTTPENLTVAEYLGLQTAIQRAVMTQKSKELGLYDLTDEEIAGIEEANSVEWNEMLDYYCAYYFGISSQSSEEDIANARLSVLAMLESAGYTEEAMLQSRLENQWYVKLEDYICKDAAVDDATVDAYYQTLVAEQEKQYRDDVGMYELMQAYGYLDPYYTPAGYRGITHILLRVDEALMNTYSELAARLEEQSEGLESGDETDEGDETPVTQEDVDAAYAAIIASVQDVIDEIMAKYESGVPFADLIAEYGTDPGMTQEPNKTDGYSVHMDSVIWDPAFVKGAFSVENVGDVAAPVVGNYGVHIVQYTRDVPEGAVPMTDEMRAAFAQELEADNRSEIMNTTMEAWMADAEIVYTEAANDYLLEVDAE